MNANDLIEAYVHDVAVLLPRKQRNDVAFELRALLQEELQGKAEDADRPADAEMAIAMLQAFGRPDDVAARYRPTLTIIDPADGHQFLKATLIGLAVIWFLGALQELSYLSTPGSNLLSAIGHWWGSTVLGSLWWPGVLVAWFGLAAWARRRRPKTAVWSPYPTGRLKSGRFAMTWALIGAAFGVFILIEPTRVLDVALGGRAAPAAYTALTYTQSFLQGQAPWLLALLVLNIPLLLTVIIMGRWTPTTRRFETVLFLATCAAMLWTALDGPVLMSEASDKMVKMFLLLFVVLGIVTVAMRIYRRVRPAPN